MLDFNNHERLITILCLLILMIACAKGTEQGHQEEGKMINGYKIKKILYEDAFSTDLTNYKVEMPATKNSNVSIKDGALVIDVDGGTTVWLNQKLSGNILIEYKRKVMMGDGRNDRLSDLNQFWMAKDLQNADFFTRNGVFEEYDSLLMYYVGMGGNYNSTTRFRKYTGDGQKVLHSDLRNKEYLLQPNKEYAITTVVSDSSTSFFVNDKKIFSFQDPRPLKDGYFGFRTTESRHVIDDLKIYQLE